MSVAIMLRITFYGFILNKRVAGIQYSQNHVVLNCNHPAGKLLKNHQWWRAFSIEPPRDSRRGSIEK